ncbi:MAG: 4-hydroxy-3-methylbut-2-enyl diphosphate reductase [Candidatus Dormibacteria bacterium]
METFRPRHTGFCFGVRDALALTSTALDESGDAAALGQVVHNSRALEALEARGLRQIQELPREGSIPVVVTAHGATPELFEDARRHGLQIVDTTCPLVRRVQRRAQEMAEQDMPVVIVGHSHHQEVAGVAGWAGAAQGREVTVISSLEEADALPYRERRGIVCQSTFPQPLFREIAERVAGRSGELEVRDTTCPVVNQRQREALAGLLDQVDVVVVVGGRNSANTVALAQTCAAHRPTHHVENAAELRPEWFEKGQRVGITSGTSTPGWVVDEVEVACRDL